MTNNEQIPHSNKRAPSLLFVDDEISVLEAIQRLLRQSGWKVAVAQSGEQALEYLSQNPVDVLVSDMRMPTMDGATLLHQVHQSYPRIVRILLTGYADMDSTIKAINEGHIYSYLSKPWEAEHLKVTLKNALRMKWLEDRRLHLEVQLKQHNERLEQEVQKRTTHLRQLLKKLDASNHQLKETYDKAIRMLVHLVEINEPSAAGVAQRVADHCALLGERLGCTPQEIQQLYYAGLLHRVGLIGMPDHIRQAPYDHLNPRERLRYHRYPQLGEAVLMDMEMLQPAAAYIRDHRERINGGGFPNHLAGDDISLGARILAVVSEFHALLGGLDSFARLTLDGARTELERQAGQLLDHKIVQSFLTLLTEENLSVDEVRLPVEALCSGMELAADLTTLEGYLLLARGSRLNGRLLSRLKSLQEDLQVEFSVSILRSSIPAGVLKEVNETLAAQATQATPT